MCPHLNLHMVECIWRAFMDLCIKIEKALTTQSHFMSASTVSVYMQFHCFFTVNNKCGHFGILIKLQQKPG